MKHGFPRCSDSSQENTQYRISNVEPQKDFEIRHSVFDIQRFRKIFVGRKTGLIPCRLGSSPFERPVTVKLRALQEIADWLAPNNGLAQNEP
jgi:hypothetical protein